MVSDLAKANLTPLFEILPLEEAMPNLLVRKPADGIVYEAVKALAEHAKDPGICAGLWLYADCLEESHAIAQVLETPIGSFWHGILHRREGDFWNSKYWLRRARTVHLTLDAGQDYHPDEFVDAVEKAAGKDPADLVSVQRAEWMALISHCFEIA
jgi:hypothetical protein